LSSRGVVSSEQKSTLFSFESRRKNSFVVFANAFLTHSRVMSRSNTVKKIDLANTKRLCVVSRQNAVIGRIKESYLCVCSVGRIPTLYYWAHIIDLVIANYRRNKIVEIKLYGKGKKDGFNFYGKSRENAASRYISVRLPPNRSKTHCRRRIPKALIVPCKHLELLYLDSTRR